MARRSYSGNAKPTTLAGAISAAATSITVADGTGYPTGATAPFVITIDSGNAAEEKVLVTTRTGNTFSGCTRAFDGTTASDHTNGASVAHTFSAVDADEANGHVNDTSDPHVTEFTVTVPANAASTYPVGVSYSYVVTGDGWPARGIVTTVRRDTTSCVQTLQSDGGNTLYIRYAPNANLTGAWSAWRTI